MTEQTIRYCLRISLNLVVWAGLFLFFTSAASAGLLLDAGIKGVYEDNITGAAADIGKQGDIHAVLYASFGGYKGVGEGTFAFLRANAEGYLYRRYSDLNASVVGLSGGVYREFSRTFSAAGSLAVKGGTYRDSERSAIAYGGVLNLRQQVYPDLWIKESYEFEKNSARSGIFSHEGHLLGIWTGYSVAPGTTATLGYSYLYRTYEEPAGYRNMFHTFSAGFTREIASRLHVTGSYDRQYIGSNLIDESHVNNIFTIGLTYSY